MLYVTFYVEICKMCIFCKDHDKFSRLFIWTCQFRHGTLQRQYLSIATIDKKFAVIYIHSKLFEEKIALVLYEVCFTNNMTAQPDC